MRIRRINSKSTVFIKKVTAIINAVIGFILIQPFIWLVVVYGEHEPYLSLARMLWLLLLLIGAPMMMFGLISLIPNNGRSQTYTADLELSRIRYAVENDKNIRR